MKLIAKKPCSFGGEKFYIGDYIPAELIADPAAQEKLGVILIIKDNDGKVSDGESGTFFTQDEVDRMIDAAVKAAKADMQEEQERLQQMVTTELQETAPGAYEDQILITVTGENGQDTSVPATPEEIQRVFAVMQMTVEDGIKEIESVTSENVLILIHASESRKGIKNAAKERADKILKQNMNVQS